MKTYSSITHVSLTPCVLALGCFDGVHLGHTAVIAEARKRADLLGCGCTVWSFSEPPKNFFLPAPVPLITSESEKQQLMEGLGVDKYISVKFTKETADISANDFFTNILKDNLKAIHIVCGYDYSFGKHGAGNTELLAKLCAEYGIGLTVIDPITYRDKNVSSTTIRQALSDGDIESATAMLGRPYSFTAEVIHGQSLARHLGFPTVNQKLDSKFVVPKYGVYVTRITIDGTDKRYYGISNVGVRPTVEVGLLFAETNIFDFSGDLYGQTVKIEFLKMLRAEQKFDDLQQLTFQVNKDIDAAKRYVSTLK